MQIARGAAQKKPFEGKHAELSERIIQVFFKVHTELGYGFSEKVYQRAFGIALRESGLKIDEQIPIHVYYHGQSVGEFYADMLINDVGGGRVRLAAGSPSREEAQLLNYLKATGLPVGLLINFGAPGKLEWARMAWTRK